MLSEGESQGKQAQLLLLPEVCLRQPVVTRNLRTKPLASSLEPAGEREGEKKKKKVLKNMKENLGVESCRDNTTQRMKSSGLYSLIRLN